ncbi:hypothetical protein AVDCRST_MAG84-2625 [uncultured Microcoleus sp.]|uniref:Uncharacterized protein n=1 Tax=uncultured Microcoleus sp. TaxID=259945 RepID=A0A6J4LZT1_9CYAN|nr:hypothetical protein AVDCRST_MAG84-2625 [uncultured Microcoleus sp.]
MLNNRSQINNKSDRYLKARLKISFFCIDCPNYNWGLSPSPN